MTKIHIRVQTIEDKIADYVENHSEEIYVDRDDSLSASQVDAILEGHADEVMGDIEMSAADYTDFSYYWEQCREATGASQDDIDDWLQGDGFYPSVNLRDEDWKRLVRNTTVNIVGIVWDAEWNFNNVAFGRPLLYSGVKESLKILGVNPYEYRELAPDKDKLKGWFPNMPDRQPKVDPNELWDNTIVWYDGVMHFCVGDLESVAEVVSSDSKNIVFKKGTNVVFYDRANGAGITEAELTDDVILPRKSVEFRNDTSNEYGVQACYWFTQSYWDAGEVQNV